jgi:hypothetical protein
MTDQQLYLAIGVPIVANLTALLIFATMMNHRVDDLNKRIDDLNRRFDDLRDLWRAELRRVEEVLGARLKHIEENR